MPVPLTDGVSHSLAAHGSELAEWSRLGQDDFIPVLCLLRSSWPLVVFDVDLVLVVRQGICDCKRSTRGFGQPPHGHETMHVQLCTLPYMATMTISEARAALPEVLDRVGRGEEVTITRHGLPVAVVVRPDALRSRRGEQALRTADQTRAALAAGRCSPLSRATGITAERADELVSAIRTDRDTRP